MAAPWPYRSSARARLLESCMVALGEERGTACLVAGRALSIEQALRLAMRAAPPARLGERVSRTFLFSDICRSTNLIEAIGDDAWGELADWHERTLRDAFTRFGGEEVDHAGDSFFVAFAEPEGALDCAVAIQRILADHRHQHGFALQVRVGIHSAEVAATGHSYRGRGVHEAARIAALARPGELLP